MNFIKLSVSDILNLLVILYLRHVNHLVRQWKQMCVHKLVRESFMMEMTKKKKNEKKKQNKRDSSL